MAETPLKPPINRRHIIAEIFLSIFAVLGGPTIVLPFLLFPIAVAFPIIVKNLKLLYIPAGVTGLVFVIFIILGYGDIVPFLSGMILIASAFGAGAGFIARIFRSLSRKAKILSFVIGGIILLAPTLFVMDMLTGWIRHPFARWRIHTYVARHYADFDLTVGSLRFDFKSGSFRAHIHDSENPEISFSIGLQGRNIRDGFTTEFWANTLRSQLTPLLQAEFGEAFHSFGASVDGVQIGQPFDTNAPVTKTARITVAMESTDPEALTAQILHYHQFIVQSGFTFAVYGITFQHATYPEVRITLPPELMNDHLPQLIAYARSNRNHNGVFADNRIGFRYVSRVVETPPEIVLGGVENP